LSLEEKSLRETLLTLFLEIDHGDSSPMNHDIDNSPTPPSVSSVGTTVVPTRIDFGKGGDGGI
jgi:hypothetical protein